ncbi:MAG: hypothetical protein Q8L93_00720 [Rhodocyclaceae bacterium]|nr:hypothetical protein [Rhodocyclaceae bacterium]
MSANNTLLRPPCHVSRIALAVLSSVTLLLGGCYSTQAHKPDESRFPETFPSGALDFKPPAKASAASGLSLDRRLVLTETGAPRLFSFRANGQSLRVTLAQFAQAYKLNIVPDADIVGAVSVEFKDLPLERALDALLDPISVGWINDDGLIRVTRQATRTYHVDYLRATRTGSGSMSTSAGSGSGTSTSSVSKSDSINFWSELESELKALLTRGATEASATPPQTETVQTTDRVTNTVTQTTRPLAEMEGRVVMNKMTGTVHVTGSPKGMRAVDSYMAKLLKGINRQVYIEARVLDVQLNDDSALGIDWSRVSFGSSLTASTRGIVTAPAGGSGVRPNTVSFDYTKTFPASFLVSNIAAAVRALEEQGAVRVVSQPRIRTLNNQPAVVRVGTERTFYTTTTTVTPVAGGAPLLTTTESPTTVTEGVMLSVTPQIGNDGFITLDVTPVVNKIVAIDTSPSGNSNAPRMETKQTSTLVRMKNGETVAIGGLIIEEDAETGRGVPGIGKPSGLGWLFRGQYSNKVRKELVIFLTPHLVEY